MLAQSSSDLQPRWRRPSAARGIVPWDAFGAGVAAHSQTLRVFVIPVDVADRVTAVDPVWSYPRSAISRAIGCRALNQKLEPGLALSTESLGIHNVVYDPEEARAYAHLSGKLRALLRRQFPFAKTWQTGRDRVEFDRSQDRGARLSPELARLVSEYEFISPEAEEEQDDH